MDDLRSLVRRFGIGLSLILLGAVLSILSDRFLTPTNLVNVLRQSTINGIIAVGMTLVILTRGIDLSVGSVLALTAVVTADLLQRGQPVMVAVLAGLGLGSLLGLVNGLLITLLNVPPFIATLGMMVFARGAALTYTQGKPITGLPEAFRTLGTGVVAAVPVPIIVAAVVFGLGYFLLNRTTHGVTIYAIGGNETAARYTGLQVGRYVTLVYVASGVLAALAGMILTARLNSAQPVAGQGYEFDAIAAVVVGGTSFAGGAGTLGGTLLGSLIIEVLKNGLNLLNVSSFYQDVVKGVVIALALLVHNVLGRRT
jgi:ribose/xylose/arabinose/galactoside ABC-type transport system permease subunit